MMQKSNVGWGGETLYSLISCFVVLIAILTTPTISKDISHLTKLFNQLPIIEINDKFDVRTLVDISIKFLTSINFNKEIVLLTNDPEIEELFSNQAKEQWFCVRNYFKLR